MQELNERVKAAEVKLDSCERRLDAHGKELEEIRIRNAEQDIQLKKMCVMQDKALALAEKAEKKLDKLDTQGDTAALMLKLVVYGIPAIAALYMALKQLGWL